MITRISFAAVGAAALLLAPSTASGQSTNSVRLDQIMSAQERVATGVSALTPAQRRELEMWLARYTATVSAVLQGMSGPVESVETPRAASGIIIEPRRSAPAQQDTIRPAPSPSPRAVPDGARIYRSASGGTFIMLADGSMWEILLEDRPATRTWRVGDFVMVQHRNIGSGDYQFQLVNPAGQQRATARFAGKIEIGNGAGVR